MNPLYLVPYNKNTSSDQSRLINYKQIVFKTWNKVFENQLIPRIKFLN